MPLVSIDGPGDPRIADYQGVSDPELVRRRGLFIAEGRLVVQRLIGDRRCRIRSLLLNDASCRALLETLASLDADVPVYVCRQADMSAISGFDMHRGCLALVERPPAIAVTDILSAARTVVVLEDVGNVDNVGGVFRNAAAFGAEGVLLSPGCCDPLYRKAIRTSMGASLRVPFARMNAWPESLDDLRHAGFVLVALTPRQPSQTIDAFARMPRPERIALVAGAEGAGLSEGALALADARVRIPILRDIDSLNLAVAIGIALARLSAEGSL